MEILLNPGSSQGSVLDAARQLLDVSYADLEKYDGTIIPVYYRLLNINFDELLALFRDDENITEAFSDHDFSRLNEVLYNVRPVVSINYEPTEINLEIISKIIEYGDKMEVKDNTMEDCESEKMPGLPVPYNNRRHKLSVRFKVPYIRTHVKLYNYKYSSLLEEYFVNLVIKAVPDEEIFINVSKIVATQTLSDYVNGFLYTISQNFPMADVMKTIGATSRYLKNRGVDTTELDNFRMLVNEALLKGENVDGVLSRDDKGLMYVTTESGLIDWYYVLNELLPRLRSGIEFDVKSPIDERYLLAFPYYGGRRYYISGTKVMYENEFDVSKLPVLMNECMERFQHVKNLINTNYSYQVITDVVKLHKFTIQETLGLVRFVVNFEGFLCSFVASLICFHVLKLFGVTDIQLRLMYSMIKQIPSDILENEKVVVCRYKNQNNPINLGVLYHGCNNVNILKDKNLDYIIQNLLKSPKNKPELYAFCHPYIISPWNLFKYITPDLSPFMVCIICRLLLNVPNLSSAEKNLLIIIANSQSFKFEDVVSSVDFFPANLCVQFDEMPDVGEDVDWSFLMGDLIYAPTATNKATFEEYLAIESISRIED